MFLGVLLVFVAIRGGAGGQGETDAMEYGGWSDGGGSIILPRPRRWTMGCDGYRSKVAWGLPGRRAIVTCASLLAAILFVDLGSLVGNSASLDPEMVEARRVFWRAP